MFFDKFLTKKIEESLKKLTDSFNKPKIDLDSLTDYVDAAVEAKMLDYRPNLAVIDDSTFNTGYFYLSTKYIKRVYNNEITGRGISICKVNPEGENSLVAWNRSCDGSPSTDYYFLSKLDDKIKKTGIDMRGYPFYTNSNG